VELGLGMTSLETCTVHHGLIFHVPNQIALSKDDDLKDSNTVPEPVENSAACMQIPRQARPLTRENLEAGINICLVNNSTFGHKAFLDKTMSSTKMLLAEIAKTLEPLISRL